MDQWNQNVNQKELLELYKKYQKAITYAVNKVVYRFNSIPLEKEDYQSIAWIGFCQGVYKHQEYQNTSKTLASFIIDSTYWKCLDYAKKYVSNKHRVLNHASCYEQFSEKCGQEKLTPLTNLKIMIKDYFESYQIDKTYQQMFYDYVNSYSLSEIARKNNLPRIIVSQFIDKIVKDFNTILV